MGNRNDDILFYTAEYLSEQRKRAHWHKIVKRLIVLVVLVAVSVFVLFHARGWYVALKSISEKSVSEKSVSEKSVSEKSAKEGAIEFKSEWENAAKQVNLTGDWSEDVLTLAQSQLGYAENQAGGSEDQLGDSGSSDGEWSATFASFCLSYAKVEDFPLETDCGQWVQKLRERKYGIYREADGYTPTPGDLIFFDMNNSGSGEDKDDSDEQEIADHVGIVVEVMPATGAVSAKVKTIEGDSDDCVQYVIYDLTDARIMGYGKLPEKTE